jgi:hypothetical protein
MSRFLSILAVALLGLALTACQPDAPAPTDAKTLAADDPAEVTERIADELKADNLLGAVQAALPPDDFDAMRAEYEKSRAETPSEAERVEFAETMEKLTKPDAEQALMAELEPALVKFETEMAAQMPLMLAMGRGFAQQWLTESRELNEQQKTQAGAMLDAVAKWLESVKFADRELARQAIAKVVATARALDLKTLDAVRALNFEEAMAKAGIVSAGTKDVLALYGLKINEVLDSVESKVVSEEGDVAKVEVEYRMFDQPLKAETEMVRRDGRWYGKDTLAKLDLERGQQADAAPEAEGASDAAADEDAPVEAAGGQD